MDSLAKAKSIMNDRMKIIFPLDEAEVTEVRHKMLIDLYKSCKEYNLIKLTDDNSNNHSNKYSIHPSTVFDIEWILHSYYVDNIRTKDLDNKPQTFDDFLKYLWRRRLDALQEHLKTFEEPMKLLSIELCLMEKEVKIRLNAWRVEEEKRLQKLYGWYSWCYHTQAIKELKLRTEVENDFEANRNPTKEKSIISIAELKKLDVERQRIFGHIYSAKYIWSIEELSNKLFNFIE
jgi:hypothetical protein